MTYIVYQITNITNNKSYIGYTSKDLDDRWNSHVKRAKLKSKFKFHNAIRKHGAEVFVREVIYTEETLAGAKETEILAILDRNPEYNSTLGGDGTHGHPITEETREKIRRNTPVRRGEDHPLFGKSRPDVIERNKSRKGVNNPKCARFGKDNHWFGTGGPMQGVTGLNHPMFGRTHSDETKAQQSASAVARCQTEEGKSHQRSAGRKGAEVRWARYRAAKEAQKLSEEKSSD